MQNGIEKFLNWETFLKEIPMSYRPIVLFLAPFAIFACSNPETEREIAERKSEISTLERQIDSAKASLDSARKIDAELRRELDSLDMGR